MGQVAFLFSGQGAQYTGMGRSLWNASRAAEEVFALADKIRPGTSNQCFSAPKEVLSLTENTQPCVYCVDLAAAQALRGAGIRPAAVAGFSLGEIAALTFAGVFSPEDGFSLVCRRGRFMNEAAERNPGGMAAVLRLSDEKVAQLCGRCKKVYPVNYNCPGQVAVAGDRAELPGFCGEVAAAGGRAVPLAVSGAFHSPFMSPAAEKLRSELAAFSVSPPTVPVYSDFSAKPYGAEPDEIRRAAALQVDHPVFWRKILEAMRKSGIDTFVETGPGKVLSGLVRRTLPGVKIFHVEDAETLGRAVSALGKKEERAC
jgi:[acyl-carrier-protein] S-malonyltransferase